jgi:hypothetical protein
MKAILQLWNYRQWSRDPDSTIIPRKGRSHAGRSTYSRDLELTRETRRCTQTRTKNDVYEEILRPCTESRWITGLYLYRRRLRDIGLILD